MKQLLGGVPKGVRARFGESIEVLVEQRTKWVKVLILGQIGSEVLFLSNK